MATTANGFPYPVGTDAADVPYWMQQLAQKIDDAFNAATWTAYTPTWTGVTVSSVTAKYSARGKVVDYHIDAVVSAAPTGAITVTLPFATVIYPTGASVNLGSLHVKDTSGGLYIPGMIIIDGGSSVTAVRLFVPASATNTQMSTITATVPIPWASGDSISIWGTYERA